jgi:hypothetical protein
MSLSFRSFILGPDDTLYLLPSKKFTEMLRAPGEHRFPMFVGARARSADVVMELENRRPTRIVRYSFDILPFDSRGFFDVDAFERGQRARLDAAFSPPLPREQKVVNAGDLFVSRGGKWSPSKELLTAIRDAALGRGHYKRLPRDG